MNQFTKEKGELRSYCLIFIVWCRVGNRLQTTWNADNRSGNIPNPRIICPEPMVGALREEGTTSKYGQTIFEVSYTVESPNSKRSRCTILPHLVLITVLVN
jgi:hypothetical protein